jgi:dinuclear metal center YbgI/SA1388 family protein
MVSVDATDRKENRAMRLGELVNAMEAIAPTGNAESWDNVGLLVGDPEQEISNVMLAIDYTPAVAREAAESACNAVVAYHPPIFNPIKRLTASKNELIYDAIRRGVSIYSPHTALDVAEGGTNDMLADALGINGQETRMPLRLIETKASHYKLVTFVPERDVNRVGEALFAAGAGRIGNYTRCSFRSLGTGTFLGEEGTHPAVGQVGKFEETAEVRVETVMPIARLHDVLEALRASHPYEEPAFDLVQLAAPPEKLGQGRVGRLSSPTPRDEIVARVKRELELDHVLVAGRTDGLASVAACCAGSCGDLLDDAIKQGADIYLSGEMRHHDALRAAQAGLTIICTLHSNSERAVLKRLAANLQNRLPKARILLSSQDQDPFTIR